MIDLDNRETKFVIGAARESLQLARRVREQMVTPALSKNDRSPVTVGDYAVQAVVSRALEAAFPEDSLVAEEDSQQLRDPAHADILSRVTEFVSGVVGETSAEEVCHWIDHGNGEPGDRFWALDPIDGTKGFLRGDQYALALGLVVEGRCQIGLLGCPNLDGGRLFIAARGQGSWVTALDSEQGFEQLRVSSQQDPSLAKVLSSFESGHTNSGQMDDLIADLGSSAELIRMDSQAKHAVLAAGEADLLLRLLSPTQPHYREKIWDQVAGALIIGEAGGRVTDLEGRDLDFSAGKTLQRNRGLLASNGQLHEAALNVITAIRSGQS